MSPRRREKYAIEPTQIATVISSRVSGPIRAMILVITIEERMHLSTKILFIPKYIYLQDNARLSDTSTIIDINDATAEPNIPKTGTKIIFNIILQNAAIKYK